MPRGIYDERNDYSFVRVMEFELRNNIFTFYPNTGLENKNQSSFGQGSISNFPFLTNCVHQFLLRVVEDRLVSNYKLPISDVYCKIFNSPSSG